MFDIDKWQEIYQSLSKHKLRTFLTAFGVFWGIFMLMILLGAGKGLQNGTNAIFSGYTERPIFMWSEKTSLAYQGLKPGRFIEFTNEDMQAIMQNVEGVGVVCPKLNLTGDFEVVNGQKNGSFSIKGTSHEHIQIESLLIDDGRFLNKNDIENARKVCVIGERVKEVLFAPDENPIGKYIMIKGVYFKIIGMFRSQKSDWTARDEKQAIYVPYTTLQNTYGMANRIGWFAISVKNGYASKNVENNLKALMRARHKIAPNDPQGVACHNTEAESKKFTGLFDAINLFIWVVGIGTIVAGIVGVSNIMLIVVKERTKEIGIRKALGATPTSIVSMVVQESIVLTLFSGYAGLILGVGIIEFINTILTNAAKMGQNTPFFKNPEINFQVAVTSVLILVIAGAMAGLVPAIKAAKVNPIEALKDE